MATDQVPTSGPVLPTAMANDINTALATIAVDHQGASAPSTGTTGLPSLGGIKYHDTTNNLEKQRDQADTTWMKRFIINETAKVVMPYRITGGRLTLVSGTPVMTSDQTAKSVVYYTPYLPGADPEISVTLDATNVVAGNLYDLFLSPAGALGYGPAWTNSTTRSAAISQANGLWTNSATMTLRLSSVSTVSCPAGTAIYLGTFYATANGQTAMQFNPAPAAGGPNAVMGLYNAYNRLRTTCVCSDSTASWTCATGFRAANNSTGNSIRFVDGLGQSSFRGEYNATSQPGPGQTAYASLGFDSSTSQNNVGNSTYFQQNLGNVISGLSILEVPPKLGLHQLYAIELSGATTTFYGGPQQMQLHAALDM